MKRNRKTGRMQATTPADYAELERLRAAENRRQNEEEIWLRKAHLHPEGPEAQVIAARKREDDQKLYAKRMKIREEVATVLVEVPYLAHGFTAADIELLKEKYYDAWRAADIAKRHDKIPFVETDVFKVCLHEVRMDIARRSNEAMPPRPVLSGFSPSLNTQERLPAAPVDPRSIAQHNASIIEARNRNAPPGTDPNLRDEIQRIPILDESGRPTGRHMNLSGAFTPASNSPGMPVPHIR